MLHVPAEPASLGLVRRYIDAAAQKAGLDRRRAYRLRLAVDEIVTNIVTHGQTDQRLDDPIDVWAWQTRHALHIVVEDASTAYDPDFEAPLPLDRDRIEQGNGGLGLFLAKANVDELRYERRRGRNRHIFRVDRLPAVAGTFRYADALPS